MWDYQQPKSSKKRLHVVAAVIYNHQQEVFLAKRSSYVDQGNLWEFPGGKLRLHETGLETLKRELNEELGITVTRAQPLIKIKYDYPDKHILLDAWQVNTYEGEPYGREGQVIRWVKLADLNKYQFPAANLPLLKAVLLPHLYWITSVVPPAETVSNCLNQLAIPGTEQLWQFTASNQNWQSYQTQAKEMQQLLSKYQGKLLLAHDKASVDQLVELMLQIQAAGLLLTIKQLATLKQRPIDRKYWLSTVIKELSDVELAYQLACDFLIISPVSKVCGPKPTQLTWNKLQALITEINLPVYAAGELEISDCDRARAVGAQGLALTLT